MRPTAVRIALWLLALAALLAVFLAWLRPAMVVSVARWVTSCF